MNEAFTYLKTYIVEAHIIGQGGSAAAVDNATEETNITRDENRIEGGTSASRFSLLRPRADGKNQAHILSAMVFLVRELQEVVLVPEKRYTVVPCRDGVFFRELAAKLEIEEPALRGVTGPALWAMYYRTIKMFKDLRTNMPVETEEGFMQTRLVKLAEQLSDLNEQLLDHVSSNKNKEWERQERGRERRSRSVESNTTPFTGRVARKRKENFSPEQSGLQLDSPHLTSLFDAVQEQTILIKEQTLLIEKQTLLLGAFQQSVSSVAIAQNLLTADLRGIHIQVQQLLQQRQ